MIWSDGGPQFTSNKFNQFSQQWGFLHRTSPYHLQSNEKIESTVKSMKKIIHTSWNVCFLDQHKFCRTLFQYRNRPFRRDGLSPHRSFMDILPRTSFLPIAALFHHNGNAKPSKLSSKPRTHRNPLQSTTMNMPNHLQKLELTPMLPFKTLALYQAVGYLWNHHRHLTQQEILCQDLQWMCANLKSLLPMRKSSSLNTTTTAQRNTGFPHSS